ncbi:YoaP domain-containing protein [Clostridium sp.]|uniref:YoaP domain-containing protein n=1 Tax=Clostridium sp. TaxID=1506 RepID=UPI003D6D48F5
MEIITLTKDNLEKEHICCAISNNEHSQVASKKQWISERFDDGLVFKKCDVRGKCFIEYIPAEKAWVPIDADGYMFINCFWVSGQLKGMGNSNLLLEECIKDSKEKGKLGLVVLSSKKKIPFLSDPKYLKYKGFLLADTSQPFYELLYLPFKENISVPQFKPHVKLPQIIEQGFVVYYSNQCPFTVKYVPLIENVAKQKGIPFKCILFETTEQAQNAPAPFTAYSLFYNGEFLTSEILSEKKFEKVLTEKGL